MSQADSKLDAGRGKFEWKGIANVQAMLLLLTLIVGAVAFYLFLSKQTLQENLAVAEKLGDEARQTNKGLREKLGVAERQIDEQLKRTAAATDTAAKAHLQMAVIKEQNEKLSAMVIVARKRLRELGGDYEVFSPTQPDEPVIVRGVVLAIANQQVEISVGSDDGVNKDLELDVYRGAKYIGRIRVTHTSSDKAVAVVIPEFLQFPIQRGDNVASRLKT